MAVSFLLLPLVVSAGTDHTISLLSGGRNRTAIVHLPLFPSAEPVERPVVVNFHTLCENGQAEADLTHMSTLADREGFIVVYPNGALKGSVEGWLPSVGVGLSWNGGTCCPAASADKVDDVQFTRDLLRVLSDGVIAALSDGKLGVDGRRLYAVGASNGAFMVNRIACEAPELFAAYAPAAGVIGNGEAIAWGYDSYNCPLPARPPPVLHFHGTLDPLVPWMGNELLGFQSVPSYIALRKALAGIENDDNGTVSFANGSAVCTAYGSPSNNFTFCKHDAGHCWPGSNAQGPCTMDVDATEQIWAFFTRYTL